MEYGQLFGVQMSGSVYAPVAYKQAITPRGNRAAYTVPHLIVVILINYQDTRGMNKVTNRPSGIQQEDLVIHPSHTGLIFLVS